MRSLAIIFLAIGSLLVLLGCQQESALAPEFNQGDQEAHSLAKKPAPNLVGTAVIDFTLTPPTFWNGTVDFGELGTFGLTFISYGAPRDYSQASPFHEDFMIYEDGNPDNVYATGPVSGVVTYANKSPDPVKVCSNGKIEVASGPFAEWQGRIIKTRGLVYWIDVGIPDRTEITVRIN